VSVAAHSLGDIISKFVQDYIVGADEIIGIRALAKKPGQEEKMGDARKLHEIWIEQCEAALSIKQRYGLDAAFDYLVAEKLLNFSEAATQHPTFAKELPRFVAEVRSIFTRKELCSEIERLEGVIAESSQNRTLRAVGAPTSRISWV